MGLNDPNPGPIRKLVLQTWVLETSWQGDASRTKWTNPGPTRKLVLQVLMMMMTRKMMMMLMMLDEG